MAAIIRFEPSGVAARAKNQRVYTRAIWGAAWDEETHLWCDELSLSVFPSMSTASLVWLYGDVLQPGSSLFARFAKKDLQRLFVKIEYDSEVEGEPIRWVGVIELGNDRLGGSRIASPRPGVPASAVSTGDQYFTAYGLEWLLANFYILTAKVDASGVTEYTDTPPVFNHRGLPNKAPGLPAFSNDPDNAEFWSTREIVDYLLAEQTPRTRIGSLEVPFNLVTFNLPDWDRPELQQQGATTYELLTQLINPRRGYAGWVTEASDIAELHTDTFTETSITIPLPAASDLPANAKPVHLIFDDDDQTSATVKESSVELYAQVIVRGERRRSVGSFSAHADSTIEKGWTDDEESAYQAGGSQTPGYAGSGTKEKRRLDELARGDAKLSHVYSYFRIPKDWDRKVGDGEGGTKNPLFPKPGMLGGIDTKPAFVFYPDMRVEQTMPLLEGVDYAGDAIANATYDVPEDERIESAPLAFMKVPGKTEWRLVTSHAKAADLEITETADEFNRWSAAVRIPPNGKGVHLDVHGAPKHVLDGSGFTYLDADEKLGKWSYSSGAAGLIFTLSIPDDRYCEGRWPADAVMPAGEESYVQRKVIYADGFRKDYVAPKTVVRVDAAGSLQRSTGGFIPKEAPDDDEHKLTAAAKLASVYYLAEHHVLSLASYRLQPASRFRLGSLVIKVGDPAFSSAMTINSPITEITISSPLGSLDNSTAPQMRVSTWAGELDPLLVAPLEPTTEGGRGTSAIRTTSVTPFPGIASGGAGGSQ